MKHRKLRIAWSMAWGVVAVLMCVLWVRSYSIADEFFYEDRYSEIVTVSRLGDLYVRAFVGDNYFLVQTTGDPRVHPRRDYYVSQQPASLSELESWGGLPFSEDEWRVIPFGLPILGVFALIAAPWFSVRRFSLRTLLIATTLIATVLGIIVWMSRAE
jgi:hypothetical protein